MIDTLYTLLFQLSLTFLTINMLFAIGRGIMGPRFTDRIVSINIIGTKTILIIAILSILWDEGALVDIAMVYALISFLAVVVLSKCYLLPHHTNPAHAKTTLPKEGENNA